MCLCPGVTDDAARMRSGVLAMVDEHLAVDDRVVDAAGMLDHPLEAAWIVARLYRRLGSDGVGIEDYEVRGPTGPNQTAVLEAEDGRDFEAQDVDRLLQGYEPLLAYPIPQDLGRNTLGPGAVHVRPGVGHTYVRVRMADDC